MNKYDNEDIDYKINDIIGGGGCKHILVLSGGGVKGIAHLGAIKFLEEKGMMKNIDTIAGTSVGGLIGGLYMIGYNADELYKFIEMFDLTKIKSINFNNIFTEYGIDDGKIFEHILTKLFLLKQIPLDITFKQLYKKTGKKLIVTATCINTKEQHYISYLTYPDMTVIMGIRMTTCVPFWMIPIKYNNMLFVDGGCIDNYPIKIFNDEIENVLGLFLCEKKTYVETINNIESYIMSVIKCLSESLILNVGDKNTIKIIIPETNMINFNMDKNDKKKLFDCGYDSVMKYFEQK